MPDFYADNPFTMVYTELWTILEQRSELSQLVAVGNRIRYDQTRDPHKRTISTADVPEILIAPESLVSNLKSSSSSTSIDVTYGVVTATGDYRYTDFLAQVQWMLFGTLIDWRNTLGQLTWQGKSFVIGVRIDTETLGFTDLDAIQEVERKQGWTSLLQFTVNMMFKTSDVQLQLTNELP